MDKIELIKEKIKEADLIIIGAGSGLSEASGIHYSRPYIDKIFNKFISKYRFNDLYSAGFYPYENRNEYWAYWSFFIKEIYYKNNENELYKNLFKLVENKNYFVLTTNVDDLFIKNGFDKEKVFATQGSYSLFQCSVPCHNKTYNNVKLVEQMVENIDEELKIPTSLIPKCPVCHKEMEMNLRCDETFVEDETRHKQYKKYNSLINNNLNKKILFLELGVGYNTPGIIKYPFERMTYLNNKSYLIRFNKFDNYINEKIKDKTLLINDDINETIKNLLKD